MMNSSKVWSAILAFSVYFLLIGLLINYFNHHTETKAVHYAQKSSKAIKVSLAPPLNKTNRSKMRSKPKKRSPKKIKSKKILKSKKSANKKKIKSASPTKRIKLNTLFDKISDKKPVDKEVKKSTENSLEKSDGRDEGIKNAYFNKVEGLMYNWPAQSEFAGFSAKVWLRINRNGSFTFKILSASNNVDFNRGLIQYLQQLQSIGFDTHQNTKPYELNVEFIAKE
ncbi:MAG: hypothetical protein DRG30_00105 [Epsilonproteobacteria bacterium]|nr:MAG: hypothetical protein DRG30_00105 [Campylobacterota bacterium]